MSDHDIFKYLIDDAAVRTVVELLLPNAEVIRLYNHYPEPIVEWWEASVPLSRGGRNHTVKVQALHYDVELSKAAFLDAIDEFDRGVRGLTLVQSAAPLPGDLHPGRFRDEDGLMRVLADLGATLYFDLPHAGEAAAVTVFGRRNLDYLVTSGAIEVDDEGATQA